MLTSKTIAVGIVKAIGILALLSLLLYIVYEIRTVLLYLIISFIFSLIANPIVDFLKLKFKISNTLAVVASLLFFVFIIIGILMLFVPLILSQSNNLSLLNAKAIENDLKTLSDVADRFFENYNIDLRPIFSPNVWLSKLNIELITNFFNSIISILSNLGIGLVSVFFITFFFLKDQGIFWTSFRILLPEKHKDKIMSSSVKIYHLLSRYFTGLLIQMLINFILYITVLLILDINNALIIAFLCAILNIVPYLGPIISTILAGFLTILSHMHGDFQTELLPSVIYVIAGFSIVQLIDNNISEPIIFSRSVKSHPLEIFLVILTGGFLFGILGMIIAVPSYTIIKVICKEFFPENKLVQILTKNF